MSALYAFGYCECDLLRVLSRYLVQRSKPLGVLKLSTHGRKIMTLFAGNIPPGAKLTGGRKVTRRRKHISRKKRYTSKKNRKV